jgi:hypothetical protein
MRLLRSIFHWGRCPQTPGIYRFFPARMDVFDFVEGDGCGPSPAFPAAEPVARVASQHCPIPSDSGRISINRTASRLNQKAANGDYPLNSVSHVWGALQYPITCEGGVGVGAKNYNVRIPMPPLRQQ